MENNKCVPNCPYFPDMSVRDVVPDKDHPYINRRKEKRVFCCLYDMHPIDWNAKCPRKKAKR